MHATSSQLHKLTQLVKAWLHVLQLYHNYVAIVRPSKINVSGSNFYQVIAHSDTN